MGSYREQEKGSDHGLKQSQSLEKQRNRRGLRSSITTAGISGEGKNLKNPHPRKKNHQLRTGIQEPSKKKKANDSGKNRRIKGYD